MNTKMIANAFVSPDLSLMKAIKALNNTKEQILLVINNNKQLVGTLTDGDIRRALIKKANFDISVSEIMKTDPVVVDAKNKSHAFQLMRKYKLRQIPVINSQKVVVDMVSWNELINPLPQEVNKKQNKVVIMAGGKGTRLDLFTKILPKPLIPVGEKPIVEHVMANFSKFGFDNFLITVNYKKEMIKSFFAESDHSSNISFIEEENYLGTAGSLSLCKKRIHETFFVSNCDVLLDADLDDFLNYHKNNKCVATVLGAVQNVMIPYGVLQADNGLLETIIEKPEYHFIVNAGIYIFEPEIFELLDENKEKNMPELLLAAKNNHFRVHVYPMICSWFDVGQWKEYKKAVDYIKTMNTI